MKILKFSAPWCNPCKMLSNVINAVKPAISVEEIDIEVNVEMRKQYGITGVPTCIMLDDAGVEVKRKSGMMTVPQFEAFCK